MHLAVPKHDVLVIIFKIMFTVFVLSGEYIDQIT